MFYPLTKKELDCIKSGTIIKFIYHHQDSEKEFSSYVMFLEKQVYGPMYTCLRIFDFGLNRIYTWDYRPVNAQNYYFLLQ